MNNNKNTTLPGVSIVMPAYNSEKTIRQSIESIINQTHTEWELIIIDDGSIDNTVSIINEFKDQRIVLIKNSSNMGVPRTRNRGIEVSKYSYIAFLDSDDLWHNEKLKIQLTFMEKKGIAFSSTDYELINFEGASMGKYIRSETKNYNQLLNGNTIGCLTVIINKEKVSNLSMPEVRHEDYATWLSILRENNIFVYAINRNLAMHRTGFKSLSSNKFKTLKWTWNIYRRVEKLNIFISLYHLMRFGLSFRNKKKKNTKL